MENEKRLIDANALFEAVDKSDRENFHKGFVNRSIHHYEHIHFMKMVLVAPTVDAVEVVRCEDCKYFGHNIENDTYCRCTGGLSDPEENDFCSYGERRTDGCARPCRTARPW